MPRRHRLLPGLSGWFVACGLLLPIAAVALPAPFPPGLEGDVSTLVGGTHLSNGCAPNGIRIEADFIDIRVECGTESGIVRLTPADDSDYGALLRTTSFVIRITQPGSARVQAASKELATQLASRDDGTVLRKAGTIRATRTDQGEGVSARQLGLLDNLRRALVWAGMLVMLAWLLASALRRATRDDWAWVGLLAAVFVAALIARLKLGYWAPLHANSHGIAELRGLVTSSDEWQGPVEADRYGVAYRQIVRAVLSLGHGRAHGAFLFAVVASSLSVIPLAILGTALSGSRWVGAIAALGLAFHPIHIGLSATESSFGLAGTLFLLGAAVLCVSASLPTDGEKRRAWWLGALALSAACELAVITLALPFAALLLAIAVTGKVDRRFWALPIAVLIASMALHLDALWPVLKQAKTLRGSEFLGTLLTLKGERNALSNPTFSSTLLRPLAIIGTVALFWYRRRSGLALVVATLLIVGLSATVNGCRTDVIRYQPIGHLLIFILAASPVLLFLDRGTRVTSLIAAVLTFAMLGTTRQAFAALRRPLLDVSAYRVAELAELPASGLTRVVVAPRRMGTRDVISDFPDFVFLANGRKLQVVEVGHEQGAPPVASCAVWVGPACGSFTQKEADSTVPDQSIKLSASPLRKECEPLIARIDAAKKPFVAADLPVPFRETEFLKVPGKPFVGLFPCADDGQAARNAATGAAQP